jgi:hypothetical protein
MMDEWARRAPAAMAWDWACDRASGQAEAKWWVAAARMEAAAACLLSN